MLTIKITAAMPMRLIAFLTTSPMNNVGRHRISRPNRDFCLGNPLPSAGRGVAGCYHVTESKTKVGGKLVGCSALLRLKGLGGHNFVVQSPWSNAFNG